MDVTKRPLVSVVMCAWKPRPDWLHDAVASVLADECDLELIVVDDGSPEPVEGLLASVEDPRLRVIRVEHGGLSRARNAGICAARGDYVRFADADDILEPTGTLALLELADEGTIVYGATQICDESLRPLSVKSSQLEGWIAEPCLLYRFDVVHTSMLFPRRVLERAGDFEPAFRQCQDWDYVLRACEVAPVRGSQAVVTRYRRHGSSASANVERALHFESMVVDRYFERHPQQAGSRLEREARAKLLMARATVCPLLGKGRREQLRLVLGAFALHPRRTLEELGRLAKATVRRIHGPGRSKSSAR
jgi:glycosyltransferase involved in cell wall biosynthesis